MSALFGVVARRELTYLDGVLTAEVRMAGPEEDLTPMLVLYGPFGCIALRPESARACAEMLGEVVAKMEATRCEEILRRVSSDPAHSIGSTNQTGEIPTMTTAITAPSCPEWCWSHDLDDRSARVVHYTPQFGDSTSRYFYGTAVTETEGTVDEPLSFTLHSAGPEMDDLNAPALRELAKNALAAAEWLEAHR